MAGKKAKNIVLVIHVHLQKTPKPYDDNAFTL